MGIDRSDLDARILQKDYDTLKNTNVNALATEFGVTRSTMRRALIRLSLRKKTPGDYLDYHKRGVAVKRAPPAARIEVIRDLAGKGFSRPQIAAQLSLHPETVSHLAKRHGIVLPGRDIANRSIRNDRVVEQTVNELEASAASLRTLGVTASGVSPEQATKWASSLRESLLTFTHLRRQLLAVANPGDQHVKA